MKKLSLAAAASLLALSVVSHAQPRPGVDVNAALKTVAPDLDARLARFKPVRMPLNASALSARVAVRGRAEPRRRPVMSMVLSGATDLGDEMWG